MLEIAQSRKRNCKNSELALRMETLLRHLESRRRAFEKHRNTLGLCGKGPLEGPVIRPFLLCP